MMKAGSGVYPTLYSDHILPVMVTLIEWCINGIVFEFSAIWLQIFFVVVYGILNIAWTLVSGSAIYPVVTWNSAASWVIGLMMFPFFALVFIAQYYATKYKC
jgi:hypothetical protein